jgi:hypothetical protein
MEAAWGVTFSSFFLFIGLAAFAPFANLVDATGVVGETRNRRVSIDRRESFRVRS